MNKNHASQQFSEEIIDLSGTANLSLKYHKNEYFDWKSLERSSEAIKNVG